MRVIQDLDNNPFVRFVYSTDWHLSATPPGKRAGAYAEQILSKLRFAGNEAKRRSAHSLCGGDVFHQKNPKALGNTFGLVNRLIGTVRDHFLDGKVYGTHGNHDILADRSESIPDQPFGTLLESGVYSDISADGPFLFKGADICVQVDAFRYFSDDMEALEHILNAPPRHPEANYRVAIIHQYADPGDRGSMFGHPTIGFNQMADCDYDVALWGHDHSRTEPVSVGRCNHIRLGSLSRASLAEDEVDRPINLAYLSFSAKGIGFKEIPVPTTPLEIAFSNAAVSVEKAGSSAKIVSFFKEMDDAVSSITSTDPREILRELAGDDTLVYDIAVEFCGL